MSEPFSTPRIIGHYQGPEPGPLVIAIGGLHGNEPAGVQALERLFELLEEEPQINPGFSFRGELIALRGNLAALGQGVRFIDQDLNRIWNPERIDALQAARSIPFEEDDANSEEEELLQLLAAIEIAIEESQPERIVFLDIHTTTAQGGIFTITGDDNFSLQIGTELYAPVIKGMLEGIKYTALHYFQSDRFGKNIEVAALCFEAGQHNEPESVDRALAATINLLRAVGCVQNADVRTLHDELLQRYAATLPVMTQLSYVHHITAADEFKMHPGYLNFQAIKSGEELATDRNGPILAPQSGYLLMPLYQQLGDEGFFIVQDFSLGVAY
ncbi:succinylglutamate desuccinylase [Lewinellaceae bacterium SD302]|nr:succinylglutamate desuccinylase [Lewinellaceae bacterium SD302]